MTSRHIFIDGEAGTTGLQIAERLAARDDLTLIRLDAAHRKDPDARREALNRADVTILCLPDDAAREAVALVDNPHTRIIDASTAHRTAPHWAYGFPEYGPGQRERLLAATRISNPGCYALAAVALLHPLVAAGLLPPDWAVSINAISGYSGGGKALIEAFEDPASPQAVSSTVYDYALGLTHKHQPEITHWAGLEHPPIFLPAVGRYYKGMLVHVPLALWALPAQPTPRDLHEAYRAHYVGEQFVSVADFDFAASQNRIDPEALNGTNSLRLHVLHDTAQNQAVVVGQLDNLGKGASGQAVQTLNLLIGAAEATGLQSHQGTSA
ncbi:MAG: N-acetyl-gamma-glutamyl-phosphate reductase [Gammaproteobacteria bacterium]